jgi:hypothetical protein
MHESRIRYLDGMAARSALFRLFLATILMLNGIASAMAAVQHAAGPGLPPAASEAAQVDPTGDRIHDGCVGSASEHPAGTDVPTTAGSTHGAGDAADPGCCESGSCQCACVNAGLAALPPVARNGFGIPGQACGYPAVAGHVAPALPHLMRPPIS